MHRIFMEPGIKLATCYFHTKTTKSSEVTKLNAFSISIQTYVYLFFVRTVNELNEQLRTAVTMFTCIYT
jgi:hypothetical protein